MRRADKYPETEVFHFYNKNPKGRINGDCVIRAVATFFDITWEECVCEMTECGLKRGLILNDRKNIKNYLASKGFSKQPQPRKPDGTKYTAGEFCRELAKKNKRYILSLAGHLVVVVNGKLWDIWDCSDRCVGNYWVK